MNYPRLLLISPHSFNNITGTGITFSNLFKGWSIEKIVSIHNDVVPVLDNVCKNDYYLKNEIKYIFPFNFFLRKYEIKQRKLYSVKNKRCINIAFKTIVKKILFGNSFIPDKFQPTAELIRYLDKYIPDVIYTTLGPNSIMELVKWVKKRYSCKLVVHIMDDWYSANFKTGIFALYQRKRMKKLYHFNVSSADLRLSICDEMSNAYNKRFGVDFIPFHNAIDTKKNINFIDINKKNNGSKVILRYIGSVLPYAQSESLADIAKAVDLLANKINICLELYVPNIYIEYAKQLLSFSKHTFIYPEISDDKEFYKTISTASILLLPSNFDKKSIDYIRYSMPTKVPAYMLSKTPILVYGPEQVAQVKYAADYEWGYSISEKSVSKLVNAIKRIVSDEKLRKRITDNAFNAVVQRHDIETVSFEFQKRICSLF